MNIDSLTIGQVKEISALIGQQSRPFDHPVMKVGAKLEIRTVTLFYTGEVIHVDNQYVTIKDVAWIADEGRFTEAQKTGEFNEVEVMPNDVPMSIGHGAIVSFNPVPKNILPRSQK